MITVSKPTAVDLVRRGVAAHQAGRLEAAVSDYTSALALDQTNAAALANRAAARAALGDTAAAFADYREALRLDPAAADTWNNRGVLRRELGDLSAARADFDNALERNPDHADARANRAILHHLQWNHAAAADDLTLALAAPPGKYGVTARRQLLTVFRGDAFYHLGRTTDAMADYRTAFADRPHAFARLVCRTVSATVRDHGAAAMLADCDRHLARDPGDYLSHARRAVILVGIGEDPSADRAACYRLGDAADAELFEAILACARRSDGDG